MKILILGADGMIGHKISQTLGSLNHTIILNSRTKSENLNNIISNATFFNYDFLKQDVIELLNETNPELVINCVGITIRRGANIIENAIKLNQKLPHTIAEWCSKHSKKLIHFSTDCVFSGTKGNYSEFDFVDAIDNYGLTKGKGEVQSQNTLTIRSSMIGRELFNKTELLEWLISEKGKSVKGFSQVIYSGVTNLYMANLIKELIMEGIEINGIYNISSPPISKYDLLNKLNRVFNLDLKIEKDDSKKSDKSLKSNKFFSKYYYHKPNWDDMINELFHDSEKFHELYKN